jgi:hypothetical protein
VTNTSAWSSTASSTITAADWNLKCPENSTINVIGINVTGEPSETITEDMGVFRALDRQYPVVVSGQLSGWDGDLTINTTTSADWTATRTLIEAQKVLLLESPFGWSKYIRIINGASAAMMGTNTQPRRVITLQYVQVDAP